MVDLVICYNGVLSFADSSVKCKICISIILWQYKVA